MYDTISSQFQDALQREGKAINSYSGNLAYTVLFRKNSDKNSMNNKLTIYYPVTENISQGQLLKYRDKIYIVENQETSENEVYYKSDLLQTNASTYVISNGIETTIPLFSYDIQNYLAETNSTISVVSGNVEMITTDNSISRSLAINDTFDAIGGTWEIQNLIYKNGIAYIYVKRTANSSNTYTLLVTANDSYGINTTSQLIATAKYGDKVISNATIQWTSSDTSKATIDNNGNASFLASGSVTFTALWVEHNITSTKTVSVNSYSVYITANDSYSTTDTPTLTATAKINDTVDNTATFTWASSDTTKATVDSTGKVAFLSAGMVTFTATWTQQNAIGTKQITITQAVSNTADITYVGSASIYIDGSTKKFTGHFYDGSGAAITLTPAWSITVPTVNQGHISMVAQTDPMIMGVKADANAIEGTFQLNLRDSNSTCNKSITVNIISM